jgi:hypothetical protein
MLATACSRGAGRSTHPRRRAARAPPPPPPPPRARAAPPPRRRARARAAPGGRPIYYTTPRIYMHCILEYRVPTPGRMARQWLDQCPVVQGVNFQLLVRSAITHAPPRARRAWQRRRGGHSYRRRRRPRLGGGRAACPGSTLSGPPCATTGRAQAWCDRGSLLCQRGGERSTLCSRYIT